LKVEGSGFREEGEHRLQCRHGERLSNLVFGVEGSGLRVGGGGLRFEV
jgi:hypothetical protein